jgi:predicted nucleotidyltransferase
VSRTALAMTDQELQGYHLRSSAGGPAAEAHRDQAWNLARRAASALRDRFGAQRVVVFGSLLPDATWFSVLSDIDLAAWGIPDDQYYRAVAAVNELSADFSVDLVDPADCNPLIREAIEEGGVEI